MGTLLSTVLIASGVVIPLEIVVAIIVVGLGVAIVMMNKKKGAPKSPKSQQPQPTSYYADLGNPGITNPTDQPGVQPGGLAGGLPGAPSDPAAGAGAFSGFGAVPGMAQVPGAPEAQAAPVAAPVATPAPQPLSQMPVPPAGTPAGWLPDPSGAPDTLRYWDGTAWTQHVAARS